MVLPYFAGKGRLAVRIAACLWEYVSAHGSINGYAEPFAGMFRVGLRVLAMDTNTRISSVHVNDTNVDAHLFWDALLCKGWLPRAHPLTKSSWLKWKRRKPSAQRTFYGHHLGFRGGMFNMLYTRHNTTASLQSVRTRSQRARSVIRSQGRRTVKVTSLDVRFQYHEPIMQYNNTLIYCDPPYVGLTFHGWDEEDEAALWRALHLWARPKHGNLVFLSSHRKLCAKTNGLRVTQLFKLSIGCAGHSLSINSDKHVLHMEYLYKVECL